jgi:5'-3' exonuclease
MLNTYIDLLPEWKGYLTEKEKIHPQRFEQFLYHIAAYEEEHFKRRGYEENEPGWQLSSENEMEDDDFYGTWYGGKPTPAAAVIANQKAKYTKSLSNDSGLRGVHSLSSNNLESPHHPLTGAEKGSSKATKKFKNVHPSSDSRSYRDYYYENKLGWSPSKEHRDKTLQSRRSHVRDYLEGLHWVLHYYHKGPPSWEWYFPHLYAPLCTDMVNLHEFYEGEDDTSEFKTFIFEQSEPFPSLAQLLSVLPPQSAGLLPKPLGELMVHPSSPIAEFYPREFTTDANGKRQSWEAVVKIPFIDGDVLLDVVNSIIKRDKEGAMDILTAAEKRRNVRGEPRLFVPPREVAFEDISSASVERATLSSRRSQAPRKSSKKSHG